MHVCVLYIIMSNSTFYNNVYIYVVQTAEFYCMRGSYNNSMRCKYDRQRENTYVNKI